MKKAIYKLAEEARKAEGVVRHITGKLRAALQPYFDFEITVDFLEGDGLCVMRPGEYTEAATGMGVEDVFALIEKEKRITEENWEPYL